VAKHDRLALAPVLVEDLNAVLGCHVTHVIFLSGSCPALK
jgi:hypothetical protein